MKVGTCTVQKYQSGRSTIIKRLLIKDTKRVLLEFIQGTCYNISLYERARMDLKSVKEGSKYLLMDVALEASHQENHPLNDHPVSL